MEFFQLHQPWSTDTIRKVKLSRPIGNWTCCVVDEHLTYIYDCDDIRGHADIQSRKTLSEVYTLLMEQIALVRSSENNQTPPMRLKIKYRDFTTQLIWV